MKYSLLFLALFSSFILKGQTYEELKSSLSDVMKFTNEAMLANGSSVDSIDYCFEMNTITDIDHCLFRIETHITSSLESIDNALFNIDELQETNSLVSCAGLPKDLKRASYFLSETESYLSLAFDDIQSAELEHTVQGVFNVLEEAKERLSSSEKELKKSIPILERLLSEIENCNY